MSGRWKPGHGVPYMCPRCMAAAILPEGTKALSRTARDEGAEVFVCGRCGERESLYGRDPADQIPMTAWPLEIATLLEEERALIKRFRGGTLLTIRAEDLEP